MQVKGLAEMTNQNTTLREPEREPERLRPHSQPCKRSNSCDSPVDATLSGPSTSAVTSTQHAAALAASALATATLASNAASSTSANTSSATTCTIASTATALTSAAYSSSSSSSHQASSVSSKRDHPSERCSPSPPKRLHAAKHELDNPLPLDLYQRRLEHQQQQQEDTKENSIVNNNNNTNEKYRSTTAHLTSGTIQKHSNSNEGGGGSSGVSSDANKKREDLARESTRSFNSPDRLARHDDNRSMDETIAAEVISSGRIEKIEDVDDVEYGDEEMELDDDVDNNSEDVCLNMKIRSSSLAAALVSPQLTVQRGLESSGHSGSIGIGVIEGGIDSARSTPLATTIPLTFEVHAQRPASRSSREGSGLDRPSSRGGLSGLPSTSASALAGGLSPVSSTAAALGLHSDTLTGSSGLGPVQSVPLVG